MHPVARVSINIRRFLYLLTNSFMLFASSLKVVQPNSFVLFASSLNVVQPNSSVLFASRLSSVCVRSSTGMEYRLLL
jgi:hypothetical protein